jgi:DNA-binding transcriptional MerR regulator
MQYRIGEFARLGGVSIKTLRYYDQIGLLQPAAIDSRSQYRSYAPAQLQTLATILALKALGASLQDIRLVIGRRGSRQQQLELLDRLRRNAELSIAAARRSLMWIEGAVQEIESGGRDVPVVLRQRPAVHVASVRARANSYDEIGLLERDLHRSIEPALRGSLWGVLWHRCAASGAIEGEPFVEVAPPARRCGAYDIRELPSATVATAYCEPTDRDAERVYDAVSRWIHLHDYQLDGPKREIYVGQILEIQFPVKCA